MNAEQAARRPAPRATASGAGLPIRACWRCRWSISAPRPGLYTLGIWAPQIIKEFGLSSLQVGFLNALPATAAVIAMVLWARHSDRTGERTWHVVGACMLASGRTRPCRACGSVVAVLVALTLVNIGISSSKPPLWSMPTMFLSGSAAAAGIATINSIGNLGGFVGPAMIGWIKDRTGSFNGGLYFVAGLLVLSAVLTLRWRARSARERGRTPRRPALILNSHPRRITHARIFDCGHSGRRHRPRSDRRRNHACSRACRSGSATSGSTSRTSTGARTTTRSTAS